MNDSPQLLTEDRQSDPEVHAVSKLPYRAPLLRAHGALHDVTALFAKSGDAMSASDINLKEKILGVVWG